MWRETASLQETPLIIEDPIEAAVFPFWAISTKAERKSTFKLVSIPIKLNTNFVPFATNMDTFYQNIQKESIGFPRRESVRREQLGNFKFSFELIKTISLYSRSSESIRNI